MFCSKSVVSVLFATLCMYVMHRVLQDQYHQHCRADLIRVLFFNQSAMCTHIADVLHVVELAYQQVVKHVTAQVITSLSGGSSLTSVIAGLMVNGVHAFPAPA